MSIKRLHFAVALSGLIAITGVARAENPRDETHVSDRMAHQNDRIREERREHEFSAQRVHERERHEPVVRSGERSMAAHNGGHVAPSEQRSLNQDRLR
jgi:hypothetical protein